MRDNSYPARKSMMSELQRILAQQPQTVWLTLFYPTSEQRYTIEQLISRVGDYANFYLHHGIKPGDLVLIILKESLDLFASFLGAIIVGAMPAYYAYPSPKHSMESFMDSIKNLLNYNEINLVMSYAQVIDVLNQLNGSFFPNCRGLFDYSFVSEGGIPDLSRFPKPRQEAFLQFSSGTTGAKKGVKITTDALFNQIAAYSPFVDFSPHSCIVSWLPHYHDMGLIACMLMPLIKTVPLVMMSPFDWVSNPKILFDAIKKWKATHVWLPNFALGHLTNTIKDDELKELNLSSVEQLICCSEPVLYETVNAFLHRFEPCGLRKETLTNCYAMAENTFAVSSTRKGELTFLQVDALKFQQDLIIPAADGTKFLASAGIPLNNVKLRIMDSQNRELPEDRVGEVWIQSDCMLEEYHNNPHETQIAFEDGYYKTGDLGFLHHGELYITGRKKDMMIIGGVNIYPQDVELILNAQPMLIPGRNLVFGVDDERIGTEKAVVLAEVQDKDKHKVDTFAISQKIFQALDISISEFVLLPPMTLKKGTAGKISRYLNKQYYLQGAYDQYRNIKHKDAHITQVSNVRELVLNLVSAEQRIYLKDDTPLFTSGLIDSFAFAELLLLLESQFGVMIDAEHKQVKYFQDISTIKKTIAALQKREKMQPPEEANIKQNREKSLERLLASSIRTNEKEKWSEWWVNHFPWRNTFIYQQLLKWAGVKIKGKVTFLGKFKIKLRGKKGSIIIGNNVIISDEVDLRTRENGKIILSDNVYLDKRVRIVAARDGEVFIGFGSEISLNTVINSGGKTHIGQFVLIAGNVNINSSSHGVDKNMFIKEQEHSHGVVNISDDVWIGAGASVVMNTNIGEGAVIASNSLVSGEIPPFAICSGIPAKVLRYRE